MKEKIIARLIKKYFQTPLDDFVSREKKFSFFSDLRKVYTIIGPRRAWKTFFVYQIIDQLLKKGVRKENTLYMYLENDELYPVEVSDLNLILEVYFKMVWFDKKQKYYVFFDEIQTVPNWQKFATKIYSEFKNIELILTGSTSSLLSSEIATWLRWKAIKTEILPLNFSEFLKFKNVFFDEYLTFEEEILLKQLISEALIYGMYPEIAKLNDLKEKILLLDDYFDLIFYKDIIERFNLKSFKKLKIFRKFLLSYMWNFINFLKLSKDVWADYNTILNWFDYFQQAFFVYELKNFDFSVGKQEKSQSKIYILDNWFYSLNFMDYKEDFWKLFENMVFMEFRKRWFKENQNIFYFKNNEFDIDFVLFDGTKVTLVQVVYELNKENYLREVQQLKKAMKKYGADGYIVYFSNALDSTEKSVNFIRLDLFGKYFSF